MSSSGGGGGVGCIKIKEGIAKGFKRLLLCLEDPIVNVGIVEI